MSDVALELQRHRATNQRARYTTVLFHAQHLNIDRRDSENFRVTASGPICKGALLLVEQVMCGTAKDLCAMVSTNQYQYEMLCPREIGGDENVMALAKIEANCFHYDPDSMHAQYCVGNSLSCFNHNCNPNAITFFTACTKEISQAIYQNPFVFFSVYAHRDIAPNEEICISYGKMIGHSNKQKSEIRCRDPACTPEQRALHLERSARDGLVEHLLYIREFLASPQFAFSLTNAKILEALGLYQCVAVRLLSQYVSIGYQTVGRSTSGSEVSR
jgi:hypothetical protein